MPRVNLTVVFMLISLTAHFTAMPGRPLAAEPGPDAAENEARELRAGKSFLPTRMYSQQQDQQILDLYQRLRVADVSDGMDAAGLSNVGLVSNQIRPLWRDTKSFRHRIAGVAVTARYVPTNKPPAPEMSADGFNRWVGQWYSRLSPEPFVPLLRPGTVLVIEDARLADVGTIGSNNILHWKSRGCLGVVTSASARDLDEITAQRVPLYFRGPGRGIRPGRNQIESVNRPVVVGGVTVMPGDVVVADGDGVVVVPRQSAEQVAKYARATLEKDKAGRRALYQRLGLPLDESVE